MSKKHINISDQLLAKFLDGKTNAFETERVLSYLNENKENLNDFLNIRSATQIDAECPIEIDFDERLNVVKQHIKTSTATKKTQRKRIYLMSVLSLAAMITGVVCVFTFGNLEKETPFTPTFVNQQDIQPDSINKQISPINQNDYQDEIADNEPKSRPEPIEKQTPAPENKEVEHIVKTEYKNTATQSEANFFEVIRPPKTPYRILCKNLDKTFDFQWNTNAEKIEATLKDKNGNTLLIKDVTQGELIFKYADYIKYQEIFWAFKATFSDGTTEEKQGVLHLMEEEK